MTMSKSPQSAAAGTAAQAAPTAAAAPAAPPRGTLPLVLSGVFIVTLDFFIVNVAIPALQQDLQASRAQIQWIVAGFGLAYGVGLITGGRMGDLYGRRKMFTLGIALFTIASTACGLAPTSSFLVGARVLQGISGALLAPQVLAILSTTHTGPARARAFNMYGLTMGLAAVLGQLVGGLLIQANPWDLGWRTCFLINLPIGIVVLALIPRLVPESRSPVRSRLDLVGVVLVTLALLAVVLPLIEGRQQGWPAWTWISFAVSVPLFAVFAIYQERRGRSSGSPLIDMTAFRERAFSVGLLAQLVFWMGQAAYFLVFALYVQQGRGLSALEAGLLFVPIGVGYMVTSTTAVHVARRLGPQAIALGGLLRVVGLGLLLFSVAQIGTTGSLAWLIPALIIDGAGQGLALAPLAATVLARVKPQYAGSATGVLSTGLQIGNALGVAIIGVIFYQQLDGGGATGYVEAFELSLVYLMGVGLVLALLVQLLPRRTGA